MSWFSQNVPVIGSLLSGIGGIAQAKQSRRNVRDQIQANKELAQFAYSKDLEQWHRQNEYNAPTAQMARLREAGLNPKMIYGTGSAAAVGQSGVSPKYQSVRTDFSKRQSILPALAMLGQFQDFSMKNAQIDLLRERKNTEEQNAALRAIQRTSQSLKNMKMGMTVPFAEELAKSQLDLARMRVKQATESIKQTSARTGLIGQQSDMYKMIQGTGVGTKVLNMILNILRGK